MRNILIVACLGLAFAGEDQPAVAYPDGYRLWPMLHGTPLGPKHGSLGKCEKPCTSGVMYFYANPKAMEGLRTGKFADGSVIADEVLEIQANEAGNGKEGARRGVGVMVKDATRYASTGGWGYGKFAGDSKVEDSTVAERKACFSCHQGKKDRDYVFTEYRER